MSIKTDIQTCPDCFWLFWAYFHLFLGSLDIIGSFEATSRPPVFRFRMVSVDQGFQLLVSSLFIIKTSRTLGMKPCHLLFMAWLCFWFVRHAWRGKTSQICAWSFKVISIGIHHNQLATVGSQLPLVRHGPLSLSGQHVSKMINDRPELWGVLQS